MFWKVLDSLRKSPKTVFSGSMLHCVKFCAWVMSMDKSYYVIESYYFCMQCDRMHFSRDVKHRVPTYPWKYFNFFSINSRPWKYLKRGQVLENPWISYQRSLEVLEFITRSNCAITRFIKQNLYRTGMYILLLTYKLLIGLQVRYYFIT